ncbi:double-cubane-cluster-containing anaerobic reductase [Jingyaoa shaoxingensis]|uniref:2-hydroxyacyl-CoA dehydratase n=1 Tax=Jingyaoa shaoxingensis TaxID=2763671 RepID=A0ABR7NAI3_9FIRM|nr:double-cubane-cluster-containing anaerobic reductase [Jingyaoa shaoxingensis]MBC8573424.1 2-hydroxyacyl-CoA dehydratase [Jingyaoa shaoxingensis]
MELRKELPEVFEEFADARKNSFLAIKKIKDAGTPIVGVFCTYLPREIANAMGAAVVGLCSVSDETIPDAEKDLPRNLCPLIKSSYGFAKTDKCPFFYFSDLVVGETTCDGKKKMYEMLAEFKPVHVVQLPNSQTEDGYELYRKELIRFKEALEEKFEVKITEEAIAKEIKKRNGINRALTRLQYTMAQDPAPVMGLDIINTVYGSGFQMNLDTLEETIDAVTDKIEKEYQEGKNVGKKPRILVTGSPSGGAALKVIRAIEENGGVVVCFENCTGMKPLAEVDEENPDVYDALSRKYLSIGCSCMSPNKARMELLEKLIKDFKVDAVVDLVLQACHTYNVETAMVKKLVKDKMGIPYTVVETDYSQADVGQIQTRMSAFIEML